MLNKKFNIWPADLIFNITLFTFEIHVINLNYLENGNFYYTKLLNNNIKKLNKTLEVINNTTTISDYNNKYSPDLLDLKAKQAKKKKEKTQKR